QAFDEAKPAMQKGLTYFSCNPYEKIGARMSDGPWLAYHADFNRRNPDIAAKGGVGNAISGPLDDDEQTDIFFTQKTNV
ncbi:MAG: hypothetical protein IKN18_06025, partial [Neisseriaceae bacterium]|nr:hypothetical protein [Neisseriaceae bacterium]